jgi:alpha-glucosidase
MKHSHAVILMFAVLAISTAIGPLTINAQSVTTPNTYTKRLWNEPRTKPKKSATSNESEWWKHAVVYEIYPRSYADSDNDGTGDLKGIIDHLDHLRQLGVDAIWLTPMFPSPQVDFGYDVSDYQAVDPQYGNLADLDRLVSEGNKRGIKVVLDLVINHSSDQHAWFRASRSSRTSPYRDFYIWRDGKAPGQPPNNWTSIFGGSSWKFDATTNQWYHHQFYPEQPDLNWRNPKVEKAMFDVARWWFNRGIYGFRLDAVDTMFEDPELRDNPTLPEKDAYGDQRQQRIYNVLMPEVHAALQRLRLVTDRYPGRVLIGETWTSKPDELVAYYGPRNNELHMPMYLELTKMPALSASEFRPRIEAVENNSVGGWPTFALSNHDIRRSADRYTPPGVNSDDVAKLIGALLITLRGTPVLYYGEELGMLNNDPKRVEDVQDVIGRKGWPDEKGRDGERTPMQWNGSANSGFNNGTKPWLPVGPDYATRNVASEQADPNSVLNWYRSLIRLRREHPAFSGDYVSVNRNDPNVLGYLRVSPKGTALVLLNMSPQPAQVSLADANVKQVRSVRLARGAQQEASAVRLEPFGVFIAEVDRAAAP